MKTYKESGPSMAFGRSARAEQAKARFQHEPATSQHQSAGQAPGQPHQQLLAAGQQQQQTVQLQYVDQDGNVVQVVTQPAYVAHSAAEEGAAGGGSVYVTNNLMSSHLQHQQRPFESS